jgi:hypothetical protein
MPRFLPFEPDAKLVISASQRWRGFARSLVMTCNGTQRTDRRRAGQTERAGRSLARPLWTIVRLYQFGVVPPLVVEPVVPEPPIVPSVVEPPVPVPPIEPVVDEPPMLPPVLSVPMLPVPLVPCVRLFDDLPRDERVVLLPVVLEPLVEALDWLVEPDAPIWSPPMLPADVVAPAPPDVPPAWASATLGMIKEIAAIEVRMRISYLLIVY